MKGWLKRNLITFLRICLAGMHNFFRNAWLTTAATAVMVVTLTLILTALVMNMALNDTIDDIAKDITFSIYLNDDVTAEQRLKLKQALEKNENVDSITYVSKDDALRLFQERNEDNTELLKGISIVNNVFPASYELTLKDLTEYQSVVAVAERPEFEKIVQDTSVDKNKERRKSIERIAGAQDFITRACIGAGLIFGLISVLIIFNTIRMAIFTRSSEIQIMKLIGATPGYIRGPYLFEASFYGIIAGLLSFVIVYSSLLALAPRVQTHIKLNETIDFFTEYWYVSFFGIIAIGMLIGFVSCTIAMGKYLRLKKW